MSEKKLQEYKNTKITVQFDPNVCEHAAECVKGLTNVFDIKNKPWINVDGASPEDICATINKCPTGALKFTLAGQSGESVESIGATEVTIVPNGPLRLRGKILVKDMEGNILRETNKCSLCRCGASQNKPWCDGEHKKIGFEAPKPPIS